jgi:DNA polymerase (family 10)
MPVHNADIARVFEEIADLLALQDANPFRVRAYRNAARTIGNLSLDLAAALREGRPLPKLPGIGADLGAKIADIARTGTTPLLGRLRRQTPPALVEMLRIPGLGPKRVRALADTLGVKSLADLEKAAREGKIRGIAGFGEKTEAAIARAAAERLGAARRFELAVAWQYAEPLLAHLAAARGAKRVVAAGSLRRQRDTVGDLDILVAGEAHDAMRRFVSYGEVAEVLAQGPTRASVRLACGLQVDLRAVPVESYGAALVYFTGSRAHNIALRRLAQGRGLKINEYGVFRGRRRIAGETEESVYAAVGLPPIPPELREDRGELEAAKAGRLPRLVERSDLRGDLHAHTRWSDGAASVAEMARAARAAGLEYLAITDHSRRLAAAHGLDPLRLRRQLAEIDAVEVEGLALLKGIEVDILDDGTLDLPDAVLGELDVVVAAVHSAFQLPRARQTERVLRALAHPRVTMLAHPVGRLLGARPGCDLDMLKIARAAAAHGKILELNAQPERLDLDDLHCRMAKEEGVRVAISSDAHGPAQFEYLRWGIGQARRGWLEAADVVNTRPLGALRALLER